MGKDTIRGKIDRVPKKVQLVKVGIRAVMRLGRWGQGIGDTLDDWGNFVKGMFILVLIVLVLTGAANWQQIQNWVQNTKEETQENFK